MASGLANSYGYPPTQSMMSCQWLIPRLRSYFVHVAHVVLWPARQNRAQKLFRFFRCADGAGVERLDGGGQLRIQALELPPADALAAHIVIDGDEKLAVRRDGSLRMLERLPHGTGVMKDTPGVDDVETREGFR